MNCVLHALKDDGINIIGVHGIGRVGKTTLMKEVVKKAELEKLFDKVVMVTVAQNPSIKKIQEDIGEFLGLKFEEQNELIRATRMSTRLKQEKKFLVVLDDLWKKIKLTTVVILYRDEHRGCKIIITSRGSDVCKVMSCQTNIEVMPLLDKESWTLFRANAGDVVASNELFEVAGKVVRECKGLPLAIKVLGLVLKNKNDIGAWEAILPILEISIPFGIEGMEKEVFQSIKYSFDYLESEEAKLCFLFCSLFPIDENIHLTDIMWFMVGEGHLREFNETLDKAESQVSFLMGNLKGFGLLLEGDYGSDYIKMHDIVRDIAIWTTSHETHGFLLETQRARLEEWPRNIIIKECQRLSLMYNHIAVLPQEPLLFPNLHTLLLNNNERLERISYSFFLKMKSLKVLHLRWTRISSLPIPLTP